MFKPFKKIKFGTQIIDPNPELSEDLEEIDKKKKPKDKDKDDGRIDPRRTSKEVSQADLDDVDYLTWRRAMAIKAHNILDDDGIEKAREFIKENKLKYTIDGDNSNSSGMVVTDETTGAKELVMRGTNINLLKKGAKYMKDMINKDEGGPVELRGGVGGMLFDPNLDAGDFSRANPAIEPTGRGRVNPQEATTDWTIPPEAGLEFMRPKVPVKRITPKSFDDDYWKIPSTAGLDFMKPTVPTDWSIPPEAGMEFMRPTTRPKHLSPEEMEEFYSTRGATREIEPGIEMTQTHVMPDGTVMSGATHSDTGVERAGRRLGEDLATDIDLLTSKGQSTKSFQESEKLLLDNPDISRLIGYSMGGGKGLILGEKHNVDTTTFNPATGKGIWDIMGDNIGKSLEDRPQHEVFKTTDDFASSWLDIMDNVGTTPNIDIQRVRSLDRSMIPGKDLLNSHSLDQFTSRGKPRGDPLAHKMAEDLHADAFQFEDMLATKSVDEYNHKEGDTFEDYWKDHNKGSTARGLYDDDAGVSSANSHVRAWERKGYEVTPKEREQLDGNWKKNGSPEYPREQSFTQSEYDNFDPVKHAGRIKAKQEALDEESGLKQATTKSGFREGVSEGLSASSVGKGLLGGIVGNTVMKAIDPKGKLGEVGDTAGSGAIAGGIVGGASEVLPGAVGAVAGVEASKAISGGLSALGASKDVSQAGGDVGGGAIGGLGAVGTGALMTGEALSLETGGVSLAVGAAIGLGAYAWGKLGVGNALESAGSAVEKWLKHPSL